jgi:hypothetical protein
MATKKARKIRHRVEVDEPTERLLSEADFQLGERKQVDDLGELLGEEYVMAATSGEQVAEDVRDQVFPEEVGGPFIETDASTQTGSPEPREPRR